MFFYVSFQLKISISNSNKYKLPRLLILRPKKSSVCPQASPSPHEPMPTSGFPESCARRAGAARRRLHARHGRHHFSDGEELIAEDRGEEAECDQDGDDNTLFHVDRWFVV